MAHHHFKKPFRGLVERLNRFPQGAPESELLHRILEILFSEKEAELVSLLPIRPFTAQKASAIWKKGLAESRKILDTLAGRGILLDVEDDSEQHYVLPPPMAGFFEFSLMRLRRDIDQKALSELFFQYINQEEGFIRALFVDGETQLGRVLVHEPALPADSHLHVLDYERSTHVIRSAHSIGIALCYCRHKMSHVGRACEAPLDICMTFNNAAAALIRHGIVRPATAGECLELLERAYEHNLVQFGENVREKVNFICNCCACCCEAMIAARRFGLLKPVHTTNFLPRLDGNLCNGCAKCSKACPVGAISMSEGQEQSATAKREAVVAEDICLGCGLCTRACRHSAIILQPRPERIITPLNSVHRTVVMAIERGKLQNLVFDNQALLSHRAMAAILGVILKLPPVKQAMASRQLKSRYLEWLLNGMRPHIPILEKFT